MVATACDIFADFEIVIVVGTGEWPQRTDVIATVADDSVEISAAAGKSVVLFPHSDAKGHPLTLFSMTVFIFFKSRVLGVKQS